MKASKVIADIRNFEEKRAELENAKYQEATLFKYLKPEYGIHEICENRDALLSAMKNKLADIVVNESTNEGSRTGEK